MATFMESSFAHFFFSFSFLIFLRESPYVAQAGLELLNPPASALVLGLQVCLHIS
jgi:hypothetical protein